MADDELLRLDYGETTQLLRALTEVRFRLLAFVPTIAGAAIAFLAHPSSAAELIAVGLVGLAATLGIFMYELRNTQLYDAALHRVRFLEQRLALPSALGGEATGGLYSERPSRPIRLFGVVTAWHVRAIVLVYAAALVASGIRAGVRFRSFAVGVLEPLAILPSQAAYLAGFVRGLTA
jgi:hypothetical protein